MFFAGSPNVRKFCSTLTAQNQYIKIKYTKLTFMHLHKICCFRTHSVYARVAIMDATP